MIREEEEVYLCMRLMMDKEKVTYHIIGGEKGIG
jgi:hypothetical protein